MENASKALIIVASTLIGVMLLSFMVYMFKRFNTTAKETDARLEQREIDEINSKFLGYETGGEHTDGDSFTITYNRQHGSSSTTVDSKQYKYGQLFGSATGLPPTIFTSDEHYRKSLIVASQSLNVVSDVVSAINDAIDTNNRNNNNYKYNSLEVQNSVEIIVDLGSYYTEFNFNKIGSNQYRYLVIEPNENVNPKYVYGFSASEISDDKQSNVNLNFVNSGANRNNINVYDMLTELRDTHVIRDSLKTYTVYKYYFYGEIRKNDFTGLIESVKFTLTKDNNFDLRNQNIEDYL